MQYGMKMSRIYAPSLGICRPQGLLLRAADVLRDVENKQAVVAVSADDVPTDTEVGSSGFIFHAQVSKFKASITRVSLP